MNARIQGIWSVDSFVVNGIDSTQFIKYSNITGYKFICYDDGDGGKIDEVYSDGSEKQFGHWSETEDNRMSMNVEYKADSTGPFYARHFYELFEIEYIKRQEMKYSLQDENLLYEITFKKEK